MAVFVHPRSPANEPVQISEVDTVRPQVHGHHRFRLALGFRRLRLLLDCPTNVRVAQAPGEIFEPDLVEALQIQPAGDLIRRRLRNRKAGQWFQQPQVWSAELQPHIGSLKRQWILNRAIQRHVCRSIGNGQINRPRMRLVAQRQQSPAN